MAMPPPSCTATGEIQGEVNTPAMSRSPRRQKLHGRAFYESIGSPKHILAPMVDQSEFAWRLLSRSFFSPEKRGSLLAYTPMLHSRLFVEEPHYRATSFQPLKSAIPSPPDYDRLSQLPESQHHLDGNRAVDRPLFVQFCANDPEILLSAARYVAPFCDAVDLNLGCPQGIARRGHYGAFLQEDWDLIYKLINTLHEKLDVPVTAKMRILETREKTLAYAKMILSAGASIITVHGRRREQKGHNTGLADWNYIRYLRDNLPPETVMFANGNILQHEDLQRCLEATGVDGVMSAEGNLHDPGIFAEPPLTDSNNRERWVGRDGKGGWRMDAVMRRYLDIIYKYVLNIPPPKRLPLALGSDPPPQTNGDAPVAADGTDAAHEIAGDDDGPPRKKQKRNKDKKRDRPRVTDPNLCAMRAHLFELLRPLVSRHTDVRDRLAQIYAGDMPAFEEVLAMVEAKVAAGIREYHHDSAEPAAPTGVPTSDPAAQDAPPHDDAESSVAAVARCIRPWWVCQPYVRPLPQEALAKGAMQLSKKERKAREEERRRADELVAETAAPEAGESVRAGEQVEERQMEQVGAQRAGVVCA